MPSVVRSIHNTLFFVAESWLWHRWEWYAWKGGCERSQLKGKLNLTASVSRTVHRLFVVVVWNWKHCLRDLLLLLLSWCLMSSDVIWHIRDKLWPMPKHGSIRKVYACLAVTCHLHFWQNDRDFLRATVVTRGWNGYRNKSQHRKSTLEKKILPPFQQGFKPATFQSRVWRSNHWAIPVPLRDLFHIFIYIV